MSPRRPPMGGFAFPGLTPGVKWLMAGVAGISITVAALNAWISPEGAERIARQIAFVPGEFWRGKLWQPLTFTFLNADYLNLLIALLVLWMFAGQLEREWGTRRFLRFYFSSVFAAGLGTAVLAFFVPAIAGHAYAGIGTAIEALAAGFALTFPDAQVLFFFVLPIRARTLIPITLGITLLIIVMSGSVIPFVPPLLGLGAGVLLVRGPRGPRQMWLRLRVWWIDRRLRRSKLRVVREKDEDAPFGRSGRGSDKFLH